MHEVAGHAPWQVIVGMVASVLAFQALGRGTWYLIFKRISQGHAFTREPLLVLFFQQTIGMGVAMIGLMAFALLGVFDRWTVLAAVVVAVAVFGLGRIQEARLSAVGVRFPSCGVSPWEYLVLLCACVLTLLQVWRFPGAWDDTSYHLPLARTILEQHSLAANEWLRFPYFPAFMQLLFAAGLYVDVILAQWLASWPVVVTLLGLMGIASRMCGHAAWGVMAWTLYVCSPALRHSFGFAYVDAGLVLFCTASILAAIEWVEGEDSLRTVSPGVLLAGGMAGVAAGMKLQGLVMGGLIAGAVAVCAWLPPRTRWRPLAVHLVGYGLACLLVGGFWYVRSYWFTGDPVHPAAGAFFGYYLWTPQDMALQVMEQASHGVPKQWRHLLSSLWHVRQPYLCVVLGWPVLMLAQSPQKKAWALLGLVTWGGVLFWFWVSQVDRYLLPVAPIGAFVCMGMVWMALRWVGVPLMVGGVWRMSLAAAGVVCAIGVAWGAVHDFLERPSLAIQRDQHPEIALLETAESLAPEYGDRVLNFGYENAFFYYSGQLMGDWVGKAAFPRMADCRTTCHLQDPEETMEVMRALGARMLLVHSDKFPFNERQYSSAMRLLAKNGPAYLYALP